ncbi:MAG: serine/threonine protein kinase [Planctomycetaceae bacterium]
MASHDIDLKTSGENTPVSGGEQTLVMTGDAIHQAEQLSRTLNQPPSQVRGYQILRSLGEGAYGSVWLGREANTGKLVAIKFYTYRRSLDWSLLNREVEKLATLYTSRKIVGLVEVGWDGDPPYYVMEYLENGSLANVLSTGPLPAEEAVRIARSLLVALVHAHGRGVLHCDLKPANVLLDADFEPRLCDFGQSRLSNEQNPALGTLFYMAPEQADLKAVPDARWDVYALGALLYHMLCGEPPHRSDEALKKIHDAKTLEDRLAEYRRVLRRAPTPQAHRRVKGVDRRLADIVDRCLQVDPQKRFPNAQAVLEALDDRERYCKRRPLIILGIVGPAVLLLAMLMIVGQLLETTFHDSESNLIASALEREKISVRFLAHSVERELETRKTELEEIAANKKLIAAVSQSAPTGYDERTQLVELLDRLKEKVDQRLRVQGREEDVSWFFDDRQGYQRWRHPLGNSLDKLYNWRDYFHGLDREFSPRGCDPCEHKEVPADIKPIAAPHISTVFRSSVTHQYMVAISVPVWNDNRTEVIGVLARTIHLDQLLAEHTKISKGKSEVRVDNIISVVDGRNGKLLGHPWMTKENMTDLTDEHGERLKWTPEQLKRYSDRLRVEKSISGSDRAVAPIADQSYDDPVGNLLPAEFGEKWLAAFAPVGDLEWIAVVQERRTAALEPIQQMRAYAKKFGIWALLTGGTLVGVLWYFVFRAIGERDERIRSRNLSPSAATPSGMKTPTDL